MQSETPEQELERRRLVESVERSLRFRYAVIGALALAGVGTLISLTVNQFTQDARMEFAASKAVNEQATSYLLEARKQALYALEAADSVQEIVEDLEQRAYSIQQEMADIQIENLRISESILRDLESLRIVVNDIASRGDLQHKLRTLERDVESSGSKIETLKGRVQDFYQFAPKL